MTKVRVILTCIFLWLRSSCGKLTKLHEKQQFNRTWNEKLTIHQILNLASWHWYDRHQTETLSALLAVCAGNSQVTGEFPSQRPVTRSFYVFFDLRLNKWLSTQLRRWWFWRHRAPLQWRHNEPKYCRLYSNLLFLNVTICLNFIEIDRIHKYHSALVQYPTMQHSEQIIAHFFFNGTLYDMGKAHCGICRFILLLWPYKHTKKPKQTRTKQMLAQTHCRHFVVCSLEGWVQLATFVISCVSQWQVAPNDDRH